MLRFDYGRTVPWVSRLPDGTFRAIAGPDMVLLHTPVALRGENLTTVGDLSTSPPATRCRSCSRTARRICRRRRRSTSQPRWQSTEEFWMDWAARNQTRGEWSDAVTRSLITLKALTYAPTGGIVAAPTTSLPEQLGGARNWDYRFCWLRDATLTLLALMNAGYYDEAQAWRDWLLRAAAGSPSQLQIMYGIAGERRLSECEVPWLPGYEGSTPVRIGNAAHGQLQLDVYGEVIDALYQASAAGWRRRPADWDFQRALLEQLEQVWQPSGQGHLGNARRPAALHLFEGDGVGGPRSRHPCDRAAVEGPVARWRELRQRIHAEVCARGFDSEIGSFVQSYGSKDLDASLLLLPTTGFLPPTTRASAAPSKRSSAACSSMASSIATTRIRQTTGFRPAKEHSSRAASGWPTRCCSLAGWTMRGGCSSGCLACATTSGCSPRSTTPARSGWSATSRRRSRTSRSSTPRTTSDMP